MIRWGFCLLFWSGTAIACEPFGQRMVSDDKDAPAVYVEVNDVPLAQPFSIRIYVCDNVDVSDLRVDAVMPAHQHGLNYNAVVSASSDNTFTVNEVLFHMPGVWELQVDLAAGEETMSYTSTVVVK